MKAFPRAVLNAMRERTCGSNSAALVIRDKQAVLDPTTVHKRRLRAIKSWPSFCT